MKPFLAWTAGGFILCRKFKIYVSEAINPSFNLSVEEWLMDYCEPDETILFLWQNKNAIVIGRNQNPYKECNLEKLEEDDVSLVRRLSGGGAVYHDLGNLNFTFITPDAYYDVGSNMNIILNALLRFGIKGSFNGRNDLIAQERKFSGNAFVSDNGINCHHGTLLVDVDIDKLSGYLTVSPLKLKSKGIESVKSRVINLKEISAEINIENLKAALIDSFNEFYSTEAQKSVLNEKSLDLNSIVEKYTSREWNYSESPEFSVVVEEKFDWGIAEVCMEVIDGSIKACKIYTDAIFDEGLQELEKNLIGEQFDRAAIISALRSFSL
jgi:lipoate-protein ligase A